MHSMRHIRITAAALGLGAPLLAFGSTEVVDNFRLTDSQGASHELYYLSDAKAVVLLCQTDFITGETIRVDGGRHVK